jgi:hypothetical protein
LAGRRQGVHDNVCGSRNGKVGRSELLCERTDRWLIQAQIQPIQAQIDESDEQLQVSGWEIKETLEPIRMQSNAKDSPEEKHRSGRLSTDEGRQIDARDEQPENAAASINESLEPDSKLAAERYSQLVKQYSPSFPIDGGRQIDESRHERDEQAQNAPASINDSLEPDSR